MVLLTSAANGATLDAINRGSYSNQGSYSPGSTGYVVGRLSATEYRNFFVFDLTAVTGPVTAATLHLYLPGPTSPGGQGGYLSSGLYETYELYDVSREIDVLTNGGSNKVATWADLGSGIRLGVAYPSRANTQGFVDVEMDAAGLAYLSSKVGNLVAIGGKLTDLGGSALFEVVFAGTGSVPLSQTQLIVATVPLPSAAWLLASAFAVLLRARRDSKGA